MTSVLSKSERRIAELEKQIPLLRQQADFLARKAPVKASAKRREAVRAERDLAALIELRDTPENIS